MKRKSKLLRRCAAGLLSFSVLFSMLPLNAVGEPMDMAGMMEQYQQYMNGSGDMSAMLEQYMGGSIDEDTAAMISQYLGTDVSALLGGETEEEPIEWVTVTIHDYDDWKEFVKNCRLDTWSQDKKVSLKADLTLKGNDIVPTFGGIFDGESHTISGLELDKSGSCRGLFRYIQEGAEVKDLNVTGAVVVEGSWETVGGIAGENLGTIARCTFDGAVDGPKNVGGIAGVNGVTGQIVGCSVSGEVSGDHTTGGIVGKNSGSLIRCISTADVNAGAENATPELDGMELGDLVSSESVTACTDTGGIAGYSAGFIQHCISRGTIGYPHTGYNVGGIVGRQSGYIVNCTNHGTVQGRKEVGGIVGQMEPFTMISMEENSLLGLSDSLSSLQGQLDSILAGLGGGNSGLSDHMTTLSELTGDAKGSIEGLLDGVGELGEGTVDTVNDLSARISRIVELAVPMIEDIEGTFGSIEDTFLLFEEALAELEEAADPAGEVMDEIYGAMDDLSDAFTDVEDAVSALKRALNNVLHALGTTDETKAALAQVKLALQQLGRSIQKTAEAVGLLADGFAKLDQDDLPGWDTGLLSEELSAVEAELYKNQDAAWILIQELKVLEKALFAGADADISDLKDVWTRIGEAVRSMADGGKEIHDVFDHIRDVIPPLQDAGGEVLDSSEIFREALEAIAEASAFTSDAMGELADIFEDQAKNPALELPKLGDDFRKNGEDLSGTLDEMLAELQSLQLTASEMTGDLIDGLRDLVGSFDDIAASMMSGTTGSGELIVDVSEEESDSLFGISLGTVSGCTNYGGVDGDTNTGGIAGSMAVEYSIDPDLELQLDSMPLTSMTFETRAVLKDSINHGDVTGRKDCSGGVAGRAGLGLVTGCTSVGDVSGESYVGGIAGMAETPVRECWAKGLLSGESYVGGVAGYAKELTDCRAQAQVKKIVAYSGAIAGDAETMSGNYFVGDELGGVDGISYTGKAEPIDMDAFLALEGVPDELRTMTVSFVFEDGNVQTITVEPGARIDAEDIPDLPAKEGYVSYWEGLSELDTVEFDTVIRAVYTTRASTLQSTQLSRDGRPILLIQGGFDSAVEVELTASTASPDLSERETLVEGWAFSLPRGGSEVTVRYLLPADYDAGALRMMVRNDGEWTEADYTVDGSYAVFTVRSGDNELACVHSPKPVWLWIAGGAGGAAVIGAAAGIVLKKKKRPKKDAA